MRIGIDAREAAQPDTGTGTYVLNLVKGLLAIPSHDDYVLFVDAKDRSLIEPAPHVEVHELPGSRIDKVQDQWTMARAIARSGLDVFHATHHDVTPLLARVPIVATVLDLAWLDLPGTASASFRLYYRALTRLALRKARKIVTISESTRLRAVHHFPCMAARTQAIPIACDPGYRVTGDGATFEALATEFGIRRPYVLYAGSFASRKNLGLLLRAMRRVSAELPADQLVLAGRPSGRDDTSLEGHRGPGLVVVDRRKTLGEMRALYENAEVLVFPSRYEGFGLPVLEAMSCGCPVVAANSTSLPEIVGEAGLLVDPEDSEALAVNLLRILSDPALRARMRADGLIRAREFDWVKVARATRENYLAAASRP